MYKRPTFASLLIDTCSNGSTGTVVHVYMHVSLHAVVVDPELVCTAPKACLKIEKEVSRKEMVHILNLTPLIGTLCVKTAASISEALEKASGDSAEPLGEF